MTPARAAEVLRGAGASMRDIFESERMGADALEFLEWLFKDMEGVRLQWMLRMWNREDSFLDFARAEWEKERKG